ncbi:hypothetical protein CPB84DRAFT_1847260 [Gymnopilus junonius]|uniref:Beta-glucuronidase C-terminal domain-containing protein n=1 Tax=Gymnopilus junonius TaxID=109634 RepID=A0A9P5NPN4_GYMJU|nr:hypothetical protein CPB84DRAFT_1847260 [Gymnopilus junonius]
MLLAPLALLCSAFTAAGAITVYGQIPLAQTAPNFPHPTLAAYDRTVLTPPAIPSPAPATAYTLNLQREANAVPGLSIPHVGGSFWGFSIEMSVVSQVLGKNSSFLQVPFLNLMANLQQRAGGVVIRIGGNTQEFAAQIPLGSLPDGRTFSKVDSGVNTTTKTPAVIYTPDMFYMTNNISSMVNVKWFFGIPFNDSVNWRLTIAESAESILGDNLLGLQAGNEPDFYQQFGRRVTYSPQQYTQEFGELIQTIQSNDNIPVKNNLIGPSISTIIWKPEDVWDTGFIDLYKDHLFCLSVEHYQQNNCAALTGGGPGNPILNPQDLIAGYLSHQEAISLVDIYLNSTMLAQQAGKPFIMFETNTASCGGFAGISDSYGAALWALDYGFQMAYGNFTHALMHIGGQNVFYNPFTSPPTNETSYNQWTVGGIYYAVLIIAEALGTTNTSQIIDLFGNNNNIYTPSYAIYENGQLNKIAIFNYIDDQTGASDSKVTISIPAGVPSTVNVKYLTSSLTTLRSSVVTKDNLTWAGQTLGNQFEVDGRFKGTLNVTQINCNTGANTCDIPVPAPGFALVFFDSSSPALSIGQASQTFTTTAYTQRHNTATYDSSTISLSQGRSGKTRQSLAGTSADDKVSAAPSRVDRVGRNVVLGALLMSSAWLMKALIY